MTQIWLTLTWDVLKCESIITKIFRIRININMRCIEIVNAEEKETSYAMININMRCIEIIQN